MTTDSRTEDRLVAQPSIGLFAVLGWQTVSATESRLSAGTVAGHLLYACNLAKSSLVTTGNSDAQSIVSCEAGNKPRLAGTHSPALHVSRGNHTSRGTRPGRHE